MISEKEKFFDPRKPFESKRPETHEEWQARMGGEVLAVVRSGLYLDFRFLDMALSALSPTPDERCGVLATDGRILCYQPSALLRLYKENPKYLNRLYLHTVFHCIFRHLWTKGRRDKRLWHLACDIAVENVIDSLNRASVKRPLTYVRQNAYQQITAEEKVVAAAPVYRWLTRQTPGVLRQLERELGPNWNRGRRETPPAFAQGVSEEQRPRIFRLIDALAKAMIPLGWRLTEDLRFAMDQDMVTLTFSEATDQILHTPTREENLKLLEYEEEHKKYDWARKPQIRKYDSVYNGRLSLCINGAKTFRDCRSYVLEDRLEDMMLSIYGEAEQVKQARLAREEAERQRQEQERKREEQRQQYNAEVDRTLALVNCAADYEIACRIRAYVSAMEKAHSDQDLSEWASWARSKADWYDPTVAKEDELLGRREHEKSQESKGPQHKGYRW
mgnify:CR=1 FL=1